MTVRLDPPLLRRAVAVADRDGEAALNALLYGAGALVASAVLLVTSSPPLVGAVLALVPWFVLAAAVWVWLAPAYEEVRRAEARRLAQESRVRTAAAEVLLSDEATTEERRAAARRLLER